MIQIEGKYNTANIYTENIDSAGLSQTISILNQPFAENSTICFMPDVHAGKYTPVGLSMTITDKISPNLIGVDIGCGMEMVALENDHIELQRLDKMICEEIPAGSKVHRYPSAPAALQKLLDNLYAVKEMNVDLALRSCGSLGGGNHFIELDQSENGRYYLIIHSGSRHLGLELATYYQNLAFQQMRQNTPEAQSLLAKLQKEKIGKKTIEKQLKKLNLPSIHKETAWLENEYMEAYLHDMQIVQEYAQRNRKRMVEILEKKMKLKISSTLNTVHNYIDMEANILHKGSISAKKGEQVLIPLNMRDGCLLCTGKGNDEWNCSAPHGAGRQMSRIDAKNSISLSQFESSMKGIYSTSISHSTISEAPFAYKPSEEIINLLQETVEINQILKPVYNFKAND